MTEAIGCYMFTCPKCGLMTPGHFPMPDDDYEGPVELENECHHCDEPLKKQFDTVGKLKAELTD